MVILQHCHLLNVNQTLNMIRHQTSPFWQGLKCTGVLWPCSVNNFTIRNRLHKLDLHLSRDRKRCSQEMKFGLLVVSFLQYTTYRHTSVLYSTKIFDHISEMHDVTGWQCLHFLHLLLMFSPVRPVPSSCLILFDLFFGFWLYLTTPFLRPPPDKLSNWTFKSELGASSIHSSSTLFTCSIHPRCPSLPLSFSPYCPHPSASPSMLSVNHWSSPLHNCLKMTLIKIRYHLTCFSLSQV